MKQILQLMSWLMLAGLWACAAPAATTSSPARMTGTDTPSAPENTPAPTSPAQPGTATPQAEVSTELNTPALVAYTHQQPDGNRIVAGIGNLPALTPVDIPLPGVPAWVVAIPWDAGSFWVVVLENGQVLGFEVNAQGWEPVEIRPEQLAPGQPPLLIGQGKSPGLLIAPSTAASPLTHGTPIFQTGFSQVFIGSNNDLTLVDDDLHTYTEFTTNALPDARILRDEHDRLLFLSAPTDKYAHNVLGDALEAGSITRIDDLRAEESMATIEMPENLVIEGLAPIWADLNGDDVREIIITVSNAEQGAQILVLNEAGQPIAAGPAIGQGYRWRHQIAVAPFGPHGELELVDVLTPHLGGVVEFYQWAGDQLQVVAQMPGYTSHIIGTRNLDMAAAGDFDGDGQIELLLPNQARTELGAIRRTADGAAVVWALPLGGQMSTNLGAVTLPNGHIALGVGQENGILRLWHP